MSPLRQRDGTQILNPCVRMIPFAFATLFRWALTSKSTFYTHLDQGIGGSIENRCNLLLHRKGAQRQESGGLNKG